MLTLFMKTNPEEIYEKIRRRIIAEIDKAKASGKTQTDIAYDSGITPKSLSCIVNGKHEPDRLSTLINLSNTFNIDITELISDRELRGFNNSGCTADNIEYLKIPLFDSKVAATPDVLEYCTDDTKGELILKSDELEHKGTLHAFQVRGDSMMPVLCDEDYVIVQRNGAITADMINRRSVYLCQIEDVTGEGLTLKRVQMVERGLLLISINPDFPARFIELKNKSLDTVIKGKVIRSWRQY